MNLKKCSVLIMGLIVFPICFFVGCQQEESIVDEPLSFLSIDKEFVFPNMPKSELKIYLEALQRLNIYEEDGLLYIKQTSGKQVEISEHLYEFFSLKVEEANQKMLSLDITYPNPRIKTRGGETGEDTRTDCVAQSVADMLKWLGTDSSSSNVSSWIKDKYGTDDVSGDHYYEVMSHYFKGSPMPIPTYQTGYDYITQPFKVVGVIGRPEGGVAHSITVLSISNNNVWYYDNQNNGNSICSITDLRYLYRIDGTK